MPTTVTVTQKRKSNADTKTNGKSDKLTKKTTTKPTKTTATNQNSTRTELELICDQATLNDYLDFVSRGIPKNPTLPILNNVLFTADKTEQLLHLTTYNLEFGMAVSLDAHVKTSGKMTLPMGAFQQLVRKFPSGEINLSSTVTINAGKDEEPALKATLSTPSDPHKQFEFMGLVLTNFPLFPVLTKS